MIKRIIITVVILATGILITYLTQLYINPYNKGNDYYREKNYDFAIEEYDRALGYWPIPEEKECSIRINLALAKIAKIDLADIDTEEKIDKAINDLLDARKVLTEKNCAGENDNNGHSKEAEKLKSEIDKMILLLKTKKTFSNSGSSKEEKEEQEKKQEQNKQEQKEEYKEQKKEAQKERQMEQEEKEGRTEILERGRFFEPNW